MSSSRLRVVPEVRFKTGLASATSVRAGLLSSIAAPLRRATQIPRRRCRAVKILLHRSGCAPVRLPDHFDDRAGDLSSVFEEELARHGGGIFIRSPPETSHRRSTPLPINFSVS